jgi:hypothetical protein
MLEVSLEQTPGLLGLPSGDDIPIKLEAELGRFSRYSRLRQV